MFGVIHREKLVPRKISDEREREFEELFLFLEYYSTNYYHIDRNDDIHPSNVLVEIVEKYGKSKALQGLKQSINDTIEETKNFKLNDIKKLDFELTSKGIVSLSTLRQRYWSKYRKIMKRGGVRNEPEYYLVNGLLCDLSSNITEEERKLLSKLAGTFEVNA